MEYYTTGQVARICGLTPQDVRRRFNRNEIKGEMWQKPHWRCRRARFSFKGLLEFVKKNSIAIIPLEGDADTELWQRASQLASQLAVRKREVVSKLLQARKRSGVFCRFRGLTDRLLAVIANLDPVEKTTGASEDRKRAALLRETASLAEMHIELRYEIAKNKAASRKR